VKHCLFIIGTILFTLLAVRCVEERPIDPEQIDPDIDYAELTVRLGKSQTKADDDIDATDDEKKIESLACFVQTFDEGIIGQEGYKSGAFLKFFTHEAKGTVNGFVDFDFAGDPPTVKLRIQSHGFKDLTQLVFIANYEQNGLTDALAAIERMEDLGKIRTPELTTEGIPYPLLMTGHEEVALTPQSATTPVVATLTRIMARIDIRNEANDGDKPFVLESAEIINPKYYSYLIEGNDDSYNIPVLEEGFQALEATGNVIEGLYTYETANDGSVGHTAVRVSGTLQGEPYVKQIHMQAAGQPVPLGRNKRYLIVLNTTSGSQEITFTFKVDDWDEGVTIPVRPDHNKPVLEGLTFSNGFDQAYWNEPEALYNMEGQPTGRITFSVTGKQEIAVKISEAISYSVGSSSDLNSLANIQVTEPELIENGQFVQHVTIDISTTGKLQNKEPVDLYIQVYNAAKPSYNETFCLTNLLNYPGTDFKPVWFDGLYWAPVNQGATQLEPDYENGQPVRTNLQMGYYFQWGRNTPHYLMPGIPAENRVLGPLSYQEANNAANINKHINSDTTNDWLLADDINQSLRNGLWDSENDGDSPCLPGWRIPKLEEVTRLRDTFDHDSMVDLSKKRYTYMGDDGQPFYFPFVSHSRYRLNENIQQEQHRILFWLSTLVEPYNGRAHVMDTLNGGIYDNHQIAYAFTVRCVRK